MIPERDEINASIDAARRLANVLILLDKVLIGVTEDDELLKDDQMVNRLMEIK